MIMYKIIQKLFGARTSGTVHCKNLSHVESVKIFHRDTPGVYVQIILKKGDKLSLFKFYPDYVDTFETNRYVLFRKSNRKNVITEITVSCTSDLMGNAHFDFDMRCHGKIMWSTLLCTSFFSFGTLGGTGCVNRN